MAEKNVGFMPDDIVVNCRLAYGTGPWH